MDASLRKPAETAVKQCLDLQSGESCAVVTDDDRQTIGEAILLVAKEITDNVVLLRYPPGDQHGEEPPRPVASAMAAADVVFAPTTKSITHTRARSEATDAGARIATLPGITDDVFLMGLDADYEVIASHCRDVLGQVEDADEIHVTSPQGTDITFEAGTREWRTDTGIIHDAGSMSNLPAGEVFISPETADGTFVVDGTMMPYGKLDGVELRFDVVDGFVTEISDDRVSEEVDAAASEVGQDAYNLAELGIGTNVAVDELVGSVLLDEKAGGTVHIAIGDDHAIGGDVDAPIHLDGILREPTVLVDGKVVDLPQDERGA